MVVSFKIMADYYLHKGNTPKAVYYRDLSLVYLGELNKMLIESPSAFGQGRCAYRTPHKKMWILAMGGARQRQTDRVSIEYGLYDFCAGRF